MRVQLLSPAGRSRDDAGAIAIIVALLATVLFVLAAFAVDIGNAYAVARQQSVAADAAALAAAAKVGEAIPPGVSCDTTLLASLKNSAGVVVGATAIAKAAADDYNTKNNKTGVSEPVKGVTVTCPTADAVEVRVDNSHPVKTTLAGVIGISQITPTSYAVARYTRVPTTGGLRPWAICDSTVQKAQNAPNQTFATGLDNQVGTCGSTASGNWGAVDFDGGSNGTPDLASWTLNGYPSPVKIPDPLLPADPGVSNASKLDAAFAALVNQVVLFPSVAGYSGGSGSGATFNAVGIATVRICGILYAGKTYNTDPGTGLTTDCWVNPTVSGTPVPQVPDATMTGATSKDNGKSVLTISNPTPTDFAFNDPDITVTSITIAGAGPGGAPLVTTAASVKSATSVVLADKVAADVPNVKVPNPQVTIAYTKMTYTSGGINVPLDSNHKPIDHIQFRWVNYATSSYSGGSQTPCAFTDRNCAGVTSLWR